LSAETTLSEGILRADKAVAKDDPRVAAKAYDEYLDDMVQTMPAPKAYRFDANKDKKLLAKLYLAEQEIVLGTVERSLSFGADGRLWYYIVGSEYESDAGLYKGLILTHNHPLRADGRHTSTFSPADVDTMSRFRKSKYYLQEMRALDDRYVCSMRRLREPTQNDPKIGLQIADLHPDYVDYSEQDREQLHNLLVQLAPLAGIGYKRIKR
jgi:hypothetical protein